VHVNVVPHCLSSRQILVSYDLVVEFIKLLTKSKETFTVYSIKKERSSPLTPVFEQIKHSLPEFQSLDIYDCRPEHSNINNPIQIAQNVVNHRRYSVDGQ